MGGDLLNVGISTHIFGNTKLKEMHLEILQSNNIDTIELSLRDGCIDIFDNDEINKINILLKKYRMNINSIHGEGGEPGKGFWLASEHEEERMCAIDYYKRLIDIAKLYKSKYLIVENESFPYWPFWEEDRKDNKIIIFNNSRNIFIESIKVLVTYATKCNVILAIENIDGLDNEYIIEIIKNANSKYLKVCIDTCHLMYDYEKFYYNIDLLIPHTVTTHISDNYKLNRCNWKDNHLYPFEGDINWKKLTTYLKKENYKGDMILEVVNSENKIDSDLMKIINRMKILWEK